MTKPLEFSSFYTLLHAIKEGEEGKKGSLDLILSEYKEGGNAESFLHELGQLYLCIGLEELFTYTKSIDLQFIGQLTKEEWDDLASKNNSDLPVYLANAMIRYVKDNELLEKLASKWEISEREVQKHVRPMSAYITEGLLDVLE